MSTPVCGLGAHTTQCRSIGIAVDPTQGGDENHDKTVGSLRESATRDLRAPFAVYWASAWRPAIARVSHIRPQCDSGQDVNLGWRLGALSIVFVSLFSILALRMWSIQVTSTTEYAEAAQNNLVKVVETPAPRGQIRDSNGRVLADTRNVRVAVIEGALVSRQGEDLLVRNLSAFADRPASEIRDLVSEARRRGDRIEVVAELTNAQVVFLAEHSEDFVGLRVVDTPVRVYEDGKIAPDVIGYIGRPDADDLEKPGISSTDVLGKAGVERQYDRVIRGESGRIKYRINARGEILEQLGEQLPSPGSTVFLTIDSDVQEILNSSLAQGLQLARELYRPGGCVPVHDDPGCPIRAVGVVLDATDGSVSTLR